MGNLARQKNGLTGTETKSLPLLANLKLKLAREDINPFVLIVVKVARSADDEKLERIISGLEQLDQLTERYVRRATMLLNLSRITAGKLELARPIHDAGGGGGPISL